MRDAKLTQIYEVPTRYSAKSLARQLLDEMTSTAAAPPCQPGAWTCASWNADKPAKQAGEMLTG